MYVYTIRISFYEYPSVCLSVCLSVCRLSDVCLAVWCLCVCLSICPPHPLYITHLAYHQKRQQQIDKCDKNHTLTPAICMSSVWIEPLTMNEVLRPFGLFVQQICMISLNLRCLHYSINWYVLSTRYLPTRSPFLFCSHTANYREIFPAVKSRIAPSLNFTKRTTWSPRGSKRDKRSEGALFRWLHLALKGGNQSTRCLEHLMWWVIQFVILCSCFQKVANLETYLQYSMSN